MNMAIPIRVLILEDNPSDAELMVNALMHAGMALEWTRVETESELTARLSPEPDLILSDFNLPQFNGFKALALVRGRGLDVPFILVSGTIGEDIAVQAMHGGADDYLLKDRMVRLGQAAIQAIDRKRMRDEMRRAGEALHDSEERFRAAFEQAGVGMALRGIDPHDSRWLRVNQKLCDILGYTQEELLQLTAIDTTPPEDRDLAVEYNEKLLNGEIKSYCREKRYMRKDGRIIWANVTLTAVSGADGRLSHIISVIEDITGRKEAEEKVRRLSRVRAVLSGTNAAIVRVRNSQELFEAACRIAVEQGQLGAAWIGSLDHATLDITPVAWAGEGAEEMGAIKSTARDAPPHGQGAVSRAVRERRAIFNNDLSRQSFVGPRRDAALKRGFRSMIALPLCEGDSVVGTFTLYAIESEFFDDDEIALLTELASNVSYALEHLARQHQIDKLSRIRTFTSAINAAIVRSANRQELFEETCRIAVEYGGFGIAWIGKFDPATLEVTPAAWAGVGPEQFTRVTTARPDVSEGQGARGQAIRERRPVFINDITANPHWGGQRWEEAIRRGYRSQIGLPLMIGDNVFGCLTMYARELNFFSADEVALLTELTGNISFALEHMARQKKIEKLSRIRSVLGEINAAIVRIRDRQELFKEACRIVAEAGRFPFAWLGLVDPEAQYVTPVAWAGAERGFLDSMQARRSLRRDPSRQPDPVARAVWGKKPLIVNDVQNDPRILCKEEHHERNINSVAILPLLVSDDVAGVLVLHAGEIGFFDDDEMKLINELAGDIGFALQTIEKQEKLDYLSYYDTLTGLPNRALFIDRASQQMRTRSGESLMVAMILLNLERFRNINEMLGRHGGDDLLKLAAQRLENAFHGKDLLVRFGADGFGVVIRGIRDAAAAAHALQDQVLGCFREPFKVNGNELRVAAKAGIAVFPGDGADADTLFNNAEAALKQAKQSGEHYLFYAPDMNARAAQVLSLETRLREATEAQQFVLHYQPKINLASGAICGLEALIRWQEPGAGLVAPGTFIQLLEETGLILEVGKWALARALTDRREWMARGCTVPRIAVNVSAIQLQQKNFSDVVINVVREQGNNPDALELEVTESLLMKDIQASIRKLSILRGLGIHIAMDDFGTGYSSLSYIAQLPIHSLKIDRSFINGMIANPQDMSIVTIIIALAHSLHLKVVAEGVETNAQAQSLLLLKCDEAQGYFFSKPLPPDQIEALLRKKPRQTQDYRAKPADKARPAPSPKKAKTGPKQQGAKRATRRF